MTSEDIGRKNRTVANEQIHIWAGGTREAITIYARRVGSKVAERIEECYYNNTTKLFYLQEFLRFVETLLMRESSRFSMQHVLVPSRTVDYARSREH